MRSTGVRAFAAAALLAGSTGAALADDLGLSVLETDDLRLIYFDPAQTYLVPHVVRSFENSLDFQRRVFGWVPYEKTTVLLKDFTDSGNAAARSAPNNAITVDIAPLSRTFETFTSSERIYMLMNHELVHVVTMDQFARQDEGWRKVFAGKLNPEGAHPETLSGLAGLGDLIATSQSPLSRNNTAGRLLGQGYHLNDVVNQMQQTTEGLASVGPILELARAKGVEMPIVEQVRQVLAGTLDPKDIAPHLTTDDEPQGERTKDGQAHGGSAVRRALKRAFDQLRHGGRGAGGDRP